MRVLAALPLAAALANAAGIDFTSLVSEHPELSTKAPAESTSINRPSVASSIISELNKIKPTAVATTTKAIRPSTLTTLKKPTSTKKAPKKPTSTKKNKIARSPKVQHEARSDVFTVKGVRVLAAAPTPIVLAAASSACAPQNNLYNYVPTTNTPNGFLVDTKLAGLSGAIRPPPGYTATFTNAFGSVMASNYLGYFQLSAYDTPACAALCDSVAACQSFNIYFERDPIIDPGSNCPNPTAAVMVRCGLWGSQGTLAQATNIGEWRTNFMVVIQGSASYNKNSVPPTIAGFTGPSGLAGAVSVDTVNGNKVNIGQSYFSGTYDPTVCSALCLSTTAKNKAAAQAAGTYTYAPCNYFNVFNVAQNGTKLGYYCNLYTDASVASYNVSYSQTYNGVSYDLINSYGYALTTVDSGSLPRPQFQILSAYLADLNITSLARAAFLSSNNTALSIDTTFPGAGLGSTDPWAGTQKSITILYTYGSNETRVFAAMINTGSYSQTNAYYASSTAPSSTLVPSIAVPATASIKIAAVTWGPGQITTPSVYAALYAAKAAGTTFDVSNGFFGIDTINGIVKGSVIYYYNSAGALSAIAPREYTAGAFP